MTAIVAMANVKGGVGKSTSAVQLALHAGARGVQVLLVDADPGRSARSWFERAGDAWPANVAVESHPWPDLHRQVVRLGAPFDLVVIDTPHSPTEGTEVGPLVAAALQVADLVVVPTSPAAADLDRLADMRAALEAEQRRRLTMKWALALTRVDLRSRTMLDQRRARITELGMPLLDVVVPMRAAVAQAFGTATPVLEYSSFTDRVMLELAAEVVR